MGILDGKRILVTGVLMESSIAFHVARIAQQEGAELVLTSFGRTMRITQTIAKRLPTAPPVIELDASNAQDFDALADRVREHVDGLDGLLHSIGFAPEAALGGNFLKTEWSDVATALQISAYSLKALAVAAQPLMPTGGSVVGLTFDASLAWPKYDWMGVAKAAFESTARYLARDLGPEDVRVNLVAAGPLLSTAAKSIPGFDELKDVWSSRAPLAWDVSDFEPAARACVALLSDWFPRAAVKLTRDISTLLELPDASAREVGQSLGLATARPGAAGTGLRQRFALRVVVAVVRRVARESGTTRLAVRSRPTAGLHRTVVAFPWRHRDRAQALGHAVAGVLDALPADDVDAVVAAAAALVRRAELGDPPGARRPHVPVVAVTGTNGKTTTSRMVARMGRCACLVVGWSSTDGVYIDGELVEAGDYSGPSGAA